ncbi:TetR family transcriptional regulator [Chroococcidiopsis sp. TS-821]|nr:TetR family transcriptional regulator [Chroococcidiopsis sp. TS-821]
MESEPLGSRNTKREQILQGAMQVFLKQGYAKTSMDRVAAAAGVSKQTIYSHFQDKEGLFVALIERVTIRSFLSEFQNPFEGEPQIVLRRIAEKFLAKMDDPEYIAFFRLVIAESARFPELAQLYTRTVVQFGFRNLSAYFEAHPELNIADTEATARIFLGSLVAFVLAQEVLHGKYTMPMQKERLISSLINCVLCQA